MSTTKRELVEALSGAMHAAVGQTEADKRETYRDALALVEAIGRNGEDVTVLRNNVKTAYSFAFIPDAAEAHAGRIATLTADLT